MRCRCSLRVCGPSPWCGRSSLSTAARRRCRWSPRLARRRHARDAPCSAARWPTACRSGASCSPCRCCRPASIAVVAGLSIAGVLSAVAPGRWSRSSAGWRSGLYFPAYSALVPVLVPPDDLLAANGLEGVVRPVLAQARRPGRGRLPRRRAVAPGAALAATCDVGPLAAAALPGVAARHPGAPRSGRRGGARGRPACSPTSARASGTWCARRGCWPRCCSRR